MINVRIFPNKIVLKWYQDGELKRRVVPKKMMWVVESENGDFTDIFTGKKMKLCKGRKEFIPDKPVPCILEDKYGYDYVTAAKLQYFHKIHPEPPRAVFYDIETTSLNPLEGEITSICWIDSYTGKEYYTLNKGEDGDEEDCILGFIKYLSDNNILSLIGFNSIGFDTDFLETRCNLLGINFNSRNYIQQDVMKIANKLFYSGSLDSIAKQLGVSRKLEVDNPVKLWKEGRFKELVEYNIQDVRVTREIYEKLDMENFLKVLWELTWCDWDKIHSNSHIGNCFYNKRLFEDKKVVTHVFRDYGGDFGGGYNFNNDGIYYDVRVYDFNSLYPNIIRNLCLSPENYPEDVIRKSRDKDINMTINPEALMNDKPGVLDTYISELLNLRKQYKAEGKDNEQLAVKILANSIYGILSQKTAKFILGGTHLAGTVTWVGRNLLKTTSKMLKDILNIETVYGKTDSLFLKFPANSYIPDDSIQRIVDKAWQDITGTENKYIQLEFEGLYEKLWIVNKNNYAYLKNGKMYLKGASFHNKKNSQFQADVTNKILELVLFDGCKYKSEIRDELEGFIAEKISTKPLSYFSIKHKPRKEPINIWDDGSYMLENGLGEPDWGFYHYACKVYQIINKVKGKRRVILYPMTHEPCADFSLDNGYVIDRKWINVQVERILKKLALPEKHIQKSLIDFF